MVNLHLHDYRWGCDHEQDARNQYDKIMAAKHTAFKVQETGFHISSNRPYFGASPDGLVSCECCGNGCLEIKCPFCIKDKELEQVANESKTFCLEKKMHQVIMYCAMITSIIIRFRLNYIVLTAAIVILWFGKKTSFSFNVCLRMNHFLQGSSLR